MKKEKVLYTLKGVHQLNLIPCGCWDKNKAAADPVSSTAWFPKKDKMEGAPCSRQSHLWAWDNDKQWWTNPQISVFSALYCPFFPDHCNLLFQIHVALTLQPAPACSLWLNSAPFGSAQLKLGSPLLLHSLELLPTLVLLFSTVCRSCILVEREGDGEL